MPAVRIASPEGKPSVSIRVDEELWEAYAEACRADGISRNRDLVEHMQRKIRARKRQQAGS